MSRHEDGRGEAGIAPEVAAALAAIDATVAGEAVDPEHAELAELALLLVADRPSMGPVGARELDQRVGRRFAPPPRPSPATATAGRRRWGWLPSTRGQFAVAAMACAVLVVAVVAGLGAFGPAGGPSPGGQSTAGVGEKANLATTAASAAAPMAHSPAAPQRQSAPAASGAAGSASGSPGSGSGSSGSGSGAAGSAPASTASPAPSPNGRKTVQSAQIQLNSEPAHVDDVAQEVFDVVGQQNGIVRKSVVSSGNAAGGFSQFLLSIPTANLQPTMTALSKLRYAAVASRTDSSQDVNDQYLGAQRKLKDSQALRTSLLAQLAAAETQEQIDSLKAQLRDVEGTISSAQATLRSLKSRTSYSEVTVAIEAVPPPAGPSSGGGGFTLHRALHDAGRVLSVVAGGALIALAVLVPLAVVLAILGWLGALLRRHRRERALDLA